MRMMIRTTTEMCVKSVSEFNTKGDMGVEENVGREGTRLLECGVMIMNYQCQSSTRGECDN